MNKHIKTLIETLFSQTRGMSLHNIDDNNVKPIQYKPKTIDQLIETINRLIEINSNGILNLNFIDVSNITNFNSLFDQENGKIQMNNKHIIEIDISGWNISTIDPFMFYDCKKLIKIKLPENINRICGRAFEHCEQLIHINVQPSTTLSYKSFGSCYNLIDKVKII